MEMEQQFCQSCGMPVNDSTFGKEADGSSNEDYCHYCYAEGRFTRDCTMDEMIEHNLEYLDEFQQGLGKEIYRGRSPVRHEAILPAPQKMEAITG